MATNEDTARVVRETYRDCISDELKHDTIVVVTVVHDGDFMF
jgi:hypothetical protein